MKFIKRNTALIILISVAFISCAVEPFDDYDYDDDLLLDEEEFDSALGDIGYYDAWNFNGEDYLDEEEWDEGVDIYLVDYEADDVGDFSEWDENGNGMLSEEEFKNSLFDTIDMDDDEQISDEEFDNWYQDEAPE
ncbi:MAG TPA: hypothetical protein VF181_09880 [Balneolaceae bacterium]